MITCGEKIPELHVERTKGMRRRMEDRSRVVIRPEGIFAGVFDGHAGVSVADRLAGRLSGHFFSFFDRGLPVADSLESAFTEMDRECRQMDCGSTAACAYVSGHRLTAANAGDASVIVIGSTARLLSQTHRLDDAGEFARIRATGARIRRPYFYGADRGLVPTRSFGDRAMREAGLISTPHIVEYDLCDCDRYILIASDGLFEGVTIADAENLLSGNPGAAAGARNLVRAARLQGAADNITTILIRPAALPPFS